MNDLLTGVAQLSSYAVAGAALVAGALALAVTRRPSTGLGVLLDLLLAAGLLRLLGDPDWQVILSAAVVVALRRLLSTALRGHSRPPATPGAGRQPRRPAVWPHSATTDHVVRPAWLS